MQASKRGDHKAFVFIPLELQDEKRTLEEGMWRRYDKVIKVRSKQFYELLFF